MITTLASAKPSDVAIGSLSVLLSANEWLVTSTFLKETGPCLKALKSALVQLTFFTLPSAWDDELAHWISSCLSFPDCTGDARAVRLRKVDHHGLRRPAPLVLFQNDADGETPDQRAESRLREC